MGRLLPCLPEVPAEHRRVSRGGLLLVGRSRLRSVLVVVLGESEGPCVGLARSEAMSQSLKSGSAPTLSQGQAREGDRDDRSGEGLVEVLVLVIAGLSVAPRDSVCHGEGRPLSS